MKRLFLVLTVALMVASFATNAHAVLFNFDVFPGTVLKNSSYTNNFLLTTYNPATTTLSVDNASLSIKMTGLQNYVNGGHEVHDSASVYSIYGGSIYIGSLTTTANQNADATTVFNLSSLLNDIAADNGNFSFSINEVTTGDKWLDGAILNEVHFSGAYTLVNRTQPIATATPEPASMALFGIGLAGMGFLRRKKLVA